MPKFYVTTPIYYVNDIPHIGHAYTTIAADVLARYKRLKGFDVMYLTGVDEHGQKIMEAAQAQGIKVQEHVDNMTEGFKVAWKTLNISNDDFIRTTSDRHKRVVQKFFKRMMEKGDVYKGQYEDWYCIPCETFWTEIQLKETGTGYEQRVTDNGYVCPDCGRRVKKVKEDTYFFKLSKYQDQLLKHIEANPDFIQPVSRRNEILSFIKRGLKDLSISRTSFTWGISVPGDEKHVIYVWFDALINYVSALGAFSDDNKMQYWPADVHVMGKEITRFHAVIWPCMLWSAGLPLPKKIFGHGWWTVEGKKMSKTTGNAIDPIALVKEFGVDPVRYFLLRQVPFGADGDFSRAALLAAYNADLANDMGNLLHRSKTMCVKYFNGIIPYPKNHKFDELSKELINLVEKTIEKVDKAMCNLAFSNVLSLIWKLINQANTYIEKEAPWKAAKANAMDKLEAIIFNLHEVLRLVAILVTPFMPSTGEKMLTELKSADLRELSFGKKIAGKKVAKGQPLFPRMEV